MNKAHSKFLLFTTIVALALTCLITCHIKANVDQFERDRLIDSVKDAQADSLRHFLTDHSQIRDTN